MLHSICQQIRKTQQWPQDWKRSVFISIPKESNAKECSNYCTIALISHTIKVMLKILQARLQQCMNCELPDVHAGFRKGRGTRDQIVNICWITEKAREFQKNIYFCLLTIPKPFTVCLLVAQPCLTLWNLTDCSPTGSSVHEILQARILEWLASPSPEDLPDPKIEHWSPALQADSLLFELQGSP